MVWDLGFCGLGLPFFFNVAVGVGCGLGTALPQEQSRLGVLLRAIYTPITFIIQLLLRGGGGSTQGVG